MTNSSNVSNVLVPYREGPRKLWVFQFTGGNSFVLKAKGSPEVDHDGRVSLWHLYLTATECTYVIDIIENNGASLKLVHAEGDREGAGVRQAMIEMAKEDYVFPCLLCPKCTFFDPMTHNHCGLDDWDKSASQQAIQSEKGRRDAKVCPVERVK